MLKFSAKILCLQKRLNPSPASCYKGCVHPSTPSDPQPRRAQLASGPFSYTEEGERNGSVIVALHGLPGSSRDFRWLGAALPPTIRFVRIDRPGFGGTPPATESSCTLESSTAFVLDALDALEIERCILVGHSLGGPLAISVAAKAPERVSALALLASAGLRPHRLWRRATILWVAAKLIDRPLIGGPTRALLARLFRLVGFPARIPSEAFAQTTRWSAMFDFGVQRRNTDLLRLPTLCAWAEDDAFIEKEIFEEHSAALPEGSRLYWPQGGHNIQKTHASELAEALVALVERAR